MVSFTQSEPEGSEPVTFPTKSSSVEKQYTASGLSNFPNLSNKSSSLPKVITGKTGPKTSSFIAG